MPDLVEGSHDRRWVGDARGFEEDTVERIAPVQEFQEGLDQISSHGTAYAPVVHSHNVFCLEEGFPIKRKIKKDAVQGF